MSRRSSTGPGTQQHSRNSSPASSVLSEDEPDIVGNEKLVSKITRALDHLAHGRSQRAMVNIGQINREFTEQVRSEELANLREAMWPEVRRLIQDSRDEGDTRDTSSRFIIKAYDGSRNPPVDTATLEKASKYMKELLDGVVDRKTLVKSDDQALTLLRLSNMVAETYHLAPQQQIDLILSMLPEGTLKAIIADSRDEGLPSVFHRVLITNETSESVHTLTNKLLNWHLKSGPEAGPSIDELQGLLRQLLPLTSNKDYNKKEFLSALLGKIESSVSGDLRERVTGLKQQLARSRIARPTPYYIDLILGWTMRAHPSNFRGKQRTEIIYHSPSLRRPPPGRRVSKRGTWGFRRRPPPPPRQYQRQVRQLGVNESSDIPRSRDIALQNKQSVNFQSGPRTDYRPRPFQGPVSRPPIIRPSNGGQFPANYGRSSRPETSNGGSPPCSIHPTSNHTESECRTRRQAWGPAKLPTTETGQYVPPYPEGARIYLDRGGRMLHPDVEKHFAGACYRCGMRSHLARNCFAYDGRAPNSHGICSTCRRGFHIECKFPGSTNGTKFISRGVKSLRIHQREPSPKTVNYNYYLQSEIVGKEEDPPKN